MAMVIERFDIWLAKNNSAPSPEDQQTVFPCLIVSPNELNRHLPTIIIAPLTRELASYPTRLDFRLNDQPAKIALDRITTIPKSHLTKKLGTLPSPVQAITTDTLAELFAA